MTYTSSGETLVTTVDGQLRRGNIDSRSDAHSLKLFLAESGITLGVTLPWYHIANIQQDGNNISIQQLQQMLPSIALPAPDPFAQPLPVIEPHIIAKRELSRLNEAKWIDIHARLANWDQDAEMDGIELIIIPRDASGEAVFANGQIYAKLTARNYEPTTSSHAFPTINQWAVAIPESNVRDNVAKVQLPFRTPLDLEASDLQPIGSLEVRYVARNSGSLAARTPVLLETFNPIEFDLRNRNRILRPRGLSYLHP